VKVIWSQAEVFESGEDSIFAHGWGWVGRGAGVGWYSPEDLPC